MKRYRYVEEYMEVIAGIRDPVTDKIDLSFLCTSPLSLARYDVGVINSIGEQIESRVALTDKQAELCVKIILKYEKQLSKIGIDISCAKHPEYRLTLREVDRRKILCRVADTLVLKFPYIESMVQQVRSFVKESHGPVRFNRESKHWELAITEYNINWAVEFANNNNFEIDSVVLELMELIMAAEKTSYSIELTYHDDQLTITNAAAELNNYIEQKLGGFDITNLSVLVDHAGILGYQVDSVFEEVIVGISNPRVYNLMINRDTKLDATRINETFADVVKYAQHTNRWPIHLYEPDQLGRLHALVSHYFEPDQIQNLDKELYNESAKVVCFTKYKSSWNHRIPVLISTAGMLFGGEKQLLLDRAEKVIYLTPEVYNQSSRGAKSI